VAKDRESLALPKAHQLVGKWVTSHPYNETCNFVIYTRFLFVKI